jgi:esterase
MSAPFVLNHTVVSSTAAKRTVLVLHGALGSGQNFRSFIKRLSDVRADYNFVLIDLRNHGASHPAPGPHTLEQCALDLVGVIDSHPELAPVTTLMGHSFGGKVAIQFVASAPQSYVDRLEQIWVLDSNPGAQEPGDNHEISRVVAAVRAVPLPLTGRQQVVDSLMQSGMSSGLSNWMTTNVVREGNNYRWAFDLDGIVTLLGDYFSKDLWPFLAQGRTRPEFHFVVAEKSDRWNGEMTKKARELSPDTRASVHILPNAGHWVHVDNPEGLLHMLDQGMSR